LQRGDSLKDQIVPFLGYRDDESKFPIGKEDTKIIGELRKLVETGASSGAQDFRTVADIQYGLFNLEVLSRRRAF